MTVRKFEIKPKVIKDLSESERIVLELLERAVADFGKAYEQQKKDGFYPEGITKKELESEAKNNPQILSPFTLVERVNGKLVATPFHEKYRNLLLPISEKIQKAAKISKHKAFSKYLKLRAESLLNGNYREADIAWLNVKNSLLDFSIGPFERYLDKLMFIKRAYQAHVGLVDTKRTNLANKIKDTLYSSAQYTTETTHSVQIPQKGVSLFIERTPLTSGYLADVVFSGEHFPCDLDLTQKYGSRIIVYSSQLRLKFDKLYYPIFKAIFEERFASKYSEDLLLMATAWNVLLYELSRQLHKFEGSRERLKELYGPIDEANGFASGIQHSKHLLVKGLISQDELEAIIITHIVWMFADWLFYQRNKGKESHVIGDSLLLDYYLTSEALKEKGGISWPNFSKIFFEIEALANKLVHLLQKGSYKETNNFIKKHANFDNFKRISQNLAKIHPTL
ncbi:hypothetical protein HYS93_00065 [Candidatus Daviesbacteria bacterium]|nr:hypothetical protein [Candidatus Daviesbacteria bacterium]